MARAVPRAELQQPVVDQRGLLLLYPVPRGGDVADLEGAREEGLHAECELLAEGDVLLAPDEEGGRRDLRPVGQGPARRRQRLVAVDESLGGRREKRGGR